MPSRKRLDVDGIMEEHGIEFKDILKVDIEDAEREVVYDPSRWIGKVSTLIVELHERMKSGCNRSFITRQMISMKNGTKEKMNT